MLTTVDNPYDPFTQYDQWIEYDLRMGYHTQDYLGRMVDTSSDLSEADQDRAIEQAMDDIVNESVLGIYKKVTKVTETQQVKGKQDR